MEAVRFIKAWKRYIKEEGYKQCLDCKNRDTSTINICCDSIKSITNCMIKNIELVEKWAKTHPEFILTEKQKNAVRGRIAEGANYVYVNQKLNHSTSGLVFFTDLKPVKCENIPGFKPDSNRKYFETACRDVKIYNFVTIDNSPLYLPDLLEEDE